MSRNWLINCLRIPSQKTKPYKLYCPLRNKRVGVTANSLRNLTERASGIFNISQSDCYLVLEEDGTTVDDEEYFSVLPHHVALVVLQGQQTWRPAQQRLEETLSALQDTNKLRVICEAVDELTQSETNPSIRRLLGEIVSTTQLSIHTKTKKQDPEWFKDLGYSFATKEQYMRENARRRIRGYFRTAADYIKRQKKMSNIVRRELTNLLDIFSYELKDVDEFSDYFARASLRDDLRLCDHDGWFRCEGTYNEDYCLYEQHRVNPYGSWQQRVFFSTWNFDHCIEKSRQVLPSLVEAVRKKPHGSVINWQYFFELLFTRVNLKLVHIECHDKTEHTSAICDPNYFYI